jgi:uncharacterized protein
METPCNKICVIDPSSRLCRGCGRTADEIAGWTAMTDAERRAIMDALQARMVSAGLSRPN